MKEELISVLVPVYNSEKYIKRCIESILKQTYKNFEIIIIDDGSTDNSKKICTDYLKKDQRVKLIKQNNRGIAYTRNRLINEAIGKYITFIDSDDYVNPKYLETLYYNCLRENAEISICNFKNTINNNMHLRCNTNAEIYIFDTEQALKKLLLQEKINTSFWGKLYKKDVFNNVVINTYNVFEDLDTMYKLFCNSKKIIYTEEILYYYYIRKDSLIHSKFDNDKNSCVIEIVNHMEDYISKRYNSLDNEILIRKMNAYFYILRNTKKNDKINKEARMFIDRNSVHALKNKNIPLKTKIGIRLFNISPYLIKPIFFLTKVRSIL